jgi:hypothetical protein
MDTGMSNSSGFTGALVKNESFESLGFCPADSFDGFERTFANSMIARLPALSVPPGPGPVIRPIPFGQDSLCLSRAAGRRLAFRQQGALKPQQPEIAHVDEKPVNQHKACCQGPPDLVSENQQDQGAEDDKKQPRHQVNQKQGIAHAGYAKKVQKHKGPPKGEGFLLLFYSPASTARFRSGRSTAILRSAAPEPKPPFYAPPSLLELSFFLRP